MKRGAGGWVGFPGSSARGSLGRAGSQGEVAGICVGEEGAPDIETKIPKVKAESDHSGRIEALPRCVRVGLGKPKPT